MHAIAWPAAWYCHAHVWVWSTGFAHSSSGLAGFGPGAATGLSDIPASHRRRDNNPRRLCFVMRCRDLHCPEAPRHPANERAWKKGPAGGKNCKNNSAVWLLSAPGSNTTHGWVACCQHMSMSNFLISTTCLASSRQESPRTISYYE